MSYDGLPPEVETKGRIGFWADWFAEWLCLIDTLCSLSTFNHYCPQLELRFYTWHTHRTFRIERKPEDNAQEQ